MLTTFNIILLTILLLVGLSYFGFKRYVRINIWITIPDEVVVIPAAGFNDNKELSVVTTFIGDEIKTTVYEHTTIMLDFSSTSNGESSRTLTFTELMKYVTDSDIEPIYKIFYDLMMYIRRPEIIKNVYPMNGSATSVDFTGNYVATLEYRNKRFQKQFLTVVQNVTTKQ